jgi:hypothetical protein
MDKLTIVPQMRHVCRRVARARNLLQRKPTQGRQLPGGPFCWHPANPVRYHADAALTFRGMSHSLGAPLPPWLAARFLVEAPRRSGQGPVLRAAFSFLGRHVTVCNRFWTEVSVFRLALAAGLAAVTPLSAFAQPVNAYQATAMYHENAKHDAWFYVAAEAAGYCGFRSMAWVGMVQARIEAFIQSDIAVFAARTNDKITYTNVATNLEHENAEQMFAIGDQIISGFPTQWCLDLKTKPAAG